MSSVSKNKGEWNQKRVRALRQHMGLTQAHMARELGMRQQTVSEWETGRYQPRGASATLLSVIAERAAFRYEVKHHDKKEPKSSAPFTSE